MSPPRLHRLARPILAGLPLFLCACPGAGSRGGGAPTFSKSYGADAVDLATDAAPTPDGGYVLVGSFNGRRLDGDLVDEDLWVSRLDAYGDVEWSHVYSENQTSVGNAEEEFVWRIARARTGGGFFLVGTVDRLVALDEYDESPKDLAVTRLDDQGNTVWTNTYGFPELPRYSLFDPAYPPSEEARSVVPTSSGGLLLGGLAKASLSVSGTPASARAPWVMRLDSDGNVQWEAFVEQDLYDVAYYGNAGIHVDETADGGAFVAVPEKVVRNNGIFIDFPDVTRLTRFDGGGQVIWTNRIDGDLSTEDVVVFDRASAGSSESFLLVSDEYDALSSPERPITVVDSNGDVALQRDDIGAFDRIYSCAHLTPSGSGEDFYCAVGRSDELSESDYLRVEIFDSNLDPIAHVDLTGAASLLNLRSYDEGGSFGFELFASDLQDPEAETGDLLDIRIDPTGSITRYTTYDRGVPAFFSWYRADGTRLGGWIEGSTDYWLWTPLDQRDPAQGMTLSRYALTSGPIWSRTFASSLARRVERALQVEVIADDLDPSDFDVVVLGQLAWDLLENPPPSDEPLSAWILRLDRDGQILSQRVLEELLPPEDQDLFLPYGQGSVSPSLRRSAHCLEQAADGDLFVAGRVQGYDRVARLDAAGDVVWCSRPLANGDRGSLRAITAVADGGVVAVGLDWIAKVDALGDVSWRRDFSSEGVGGAVELANGDLLVAASFRGLPIVLALSPDGDLAWERFIDTEGSPSFDEVVGLVATADDAAVLALGKLTRLAARQSDVLESDAWDLHLMKVDSAGTFLWSQTYGALLEESLGDVEVVPDGGVLLAGRSDSLGVDSEAWLLRTDSSGEIVAGCRAALARHEPAGAGIPSVVFSLLASEPSIATADDVPGMLQSFSTNALRFSVADQVVVARQCSGFSKDVPPVPDVLLRVAIESGSGSVREDVPPGESPLIDCLTACQVAVPMGTVVSLRATPAPGFLAPTWAGGDCGAGPSLTCSVTMNGDRTVTLSFPPEGYDGELFDLNVDFLGSGTGRVEIQPLNAVCTQDCTFADLALPGDVYFLTATPDEGSTFGGWSGADDVDNDLARVDFGNADRTVTVTFD